MLVFLRSSPHLFPVARGSLILLVCAVVSVSAWGAATNVLSRIDRAVVDLENLRTLARDSTNEADRAVWARRVELAEKEVGNARRLAELETRAVELARARRSRGDTAQSLRGLLRDIDTNTAAVVSVGAELDSRIRQVRSRRTAKAADLAQTGQDEESAQRRADLAQAIQTLDTEIETLILRREVIEYRLRLIRESVRVDANLDEEAVVTRPTISSLLARRRLVDEAVKATEAVEVTLERVGQQREGTAERLALEKERFQHLDEEIATLDELNRATKTSIFSFKKVDPALQERQRRIASVLADSRSHKETLGEQIKLLEDQVGALDDSIGILQQGLALVKAEHAHIQAQIADMTERIVRRISIPATIVAGLIVLDFVLGRILLPLVFRRENLLVARRFTNYMVLMLVVGVLVVFFMEDLKAIATLLGLVGAAIVIALQDLCSAFAGWFVIVSGRKVRVGDRVEVDGVKGDVVDIQILRTTLMEVNNWLGVDEQTGRVITIPNSFIFKSNVFNFTRQHDFVWARLDITVTYETPFEESRELMFRILKEETAAEFEAAAKAQAEAESRHGLPEAHYEPKMHVVLADSGVLYSLLYVAHYKRLPATRTRLNNRIMAEFAKDTRMQLAYPTTRQFSEETVIHKTADGSIIARP